MIDLVNFFITTNVKRMLLIVNQDVLLSQIQFMLKTYIR